MTKTIEHPKVCHNCGFPWNDYAYLPNLTVLTCTVCLVFYSSAAKRCFSLRMPIAELLENDQVHHN